MPTFLPPPCQVSTPPLPPFVSCRCACSSIISCALDGSTGAVAGAVSSLPVLMVAVAAGSTAAGTGSEAFTGVVMIMALAVCVLTFALWMCVLCESAW